MLKIWSNLFWTKATIISLCSQYEAAEREILSYSMMIDIEYIVNCKNRYYLNIVVF